MLLGWADLWGRVGACDSSCVLLLCNDLSVSRYHISQVDSMDEGVIHAP
jgi:hypothetical protein